MNAVSIPPQTAPTAALPPLDPLPFSVRPDSPDRHEWELLLAAVGRLRIRVTPAPDSP